TASPSSSLCLSKWLPFLTFLLSSLSISTYYKGEMLPVIIPASIPPSPQKVKTGAVNGNIPAKAIAAQAPPASPTLAPA
ncbi:hypothetical protein, partial [Microcystis aeruginosa]|uniref:hypothetical protein n=1 Tax=Microcystis aeruginosa TaxID=1126 RepID=UPI001B8CB261